MGATVGRATEWSVIEAFLKRSVDGPHALVIENWGAYVIEPVDQTSCRLLARSRAERNPRGVAYLLAIELPHAVMERKMMLGIKARAERSHGGS